MISFTSLLITNFFDNNQFLASSLSIFNGWCHDQLFIFVSFIIPDVNVLGPFKAYLGLFPVTSAIMLPLCMNAPSREDNNRYADNDYSCGVVDIYMLLIIIDALLINELTDKLWLVFPAINTATIGIVQGLWFWVPNRLDHLSSCLVVFSWLLC